MTYFEKSTENFLKQLEFDTDFYDVHTQQELLQYTADFLDEYDIEIKEGCDYRNDQSENRWSYCDLASERAQSMVDIYHSDLRENAKRFQYFIEEAINDF